MNRYLRAIAFFTLTLLAISAPAAAEEPLKRKKLIEWGWDEPGTEFLKAHAAEMDQLPFDGFVFHVPPIDGRNFVWTMWSGQRFSWEGFAKPLAELQSSKFTRLNARFFRVNVTPGNVDWFDDAAWSAVQHNFGLAARFAREGGATGFMFDTEQYQGDLFSYDKQPGKEKRSFAEYQAKVRERGSQWMREVNQHYPDITILLTFGYYYAQPRTEKGEKDRSQAHYGLLADFLDGMFAACSENSQIVDAWEPSYGYKRRDQFEKARDTILNRTLEWTADKEKYRKHGRAGFGVWMDNDPSKYGWNTDDVAKNYFTPAEFTTSVQTALELSDEYVWIYTEKPRWWTREKLPTEYIDALKNAREKSGVKK